MICGGFFYAARIEAEKSPYFPYRLGSIVLNKRKTISKGHNTTKTHARMAKEYGYIGGIHAEAKALMNNSDGDTLVVVRIKKDGSFSCSKPCNRCLQYAIDSGIRRIIFTNWSGQPEEMRI